ncbi:AAA family ATPase [Singulisphaera sp. PoT]|uniref:AAA family ATPase n=1 Tax=Singulisphaera sp. PoT TaxID=3411797 RepID=UPI003BF6199B
MRLHGLRIENFKRVQAFDFRFNKAGTIEICGRNGQGKSSVIDAIWAAIGGKDASPDQPIRSGARAASVVVDLGEIRVERRWDLKGGSKLIVTDAGGAKKASPQTLLDGLIARLAFDPMEFARARPSAQAETLRRVSGLDFTALDRRRAEAYAERTEVHRAIKAQEAQLAEMPEVEPTEEVSASALHAKLAEANKHNASVDQTMRTIDRKYDLIASLEREIKEAEAKLVGLKERLTTVESERAALAKDAPVAIDTAPILAEITSIEETNTRARQFRDREAAAANLDANRRHASKLTASIDGIDAERSRILAATEFPIPGLSLEADSQGASYVTFNGVPLAQSSTAEQIRVSLGMSAALNPQLRLIIIKEGSLLDDRSLALVAGWAEENDYQVIVERVADEAKGFGVVIEEGLVKEERELELAGA